MKEGVFVDIKLYKCNAERKRVDKSAFLGQGLQITGAQVKGLFSVSEPELVLHYSGDLSGYNYAKINVDGTDYYYFAQISGDVGQQMRVICKRDPLYSFAAQLLSRSAPVPILVDRCTKQAQAADLAGYNSMIPDSKIKLSAAGYYREFSLTGINFAYPSGYGTAVPQYVLGVIG